MTHASLVSHKGSQVAGFALVVLGKTLDLAPVSGAPLAGKEPEGSVPGGLKLSVTLTRGEGVLETLKGEEGVFNIINRWGL